jgi:hypothetical protein
VVTEISRRQDLNQEGVMTGWYWMPLRYLAVTDGNGMWETLARQSAGSLFDLMEYPELASPGPAPAETPSDYEKQFPALRIARVRRGLTSATLILGGSSRFFTLRRGRAVIGAVRVASAFFGRGQFVPTKGEKRGESYVLTQALDAGYYQPLGKRQPAGVDHWYAMREARTRTEVCKLTTTATITAIKNGFRMRVQAEGTADVPVVIEIGLQGSGTLEGADRFLESGHATWRVGDDSIRFGPGLKQHEYVDVRGAEGRLPMKSVYLTGFAPFDHTVQFES